MTLEDFSRILELRRLMKFEAQEIDNAHEQATSITSHITGMPHGSGGVGSMVENACVRADVHLERYVRYEKELDGIFARLKQESETLSEDQSKVIKSYYIENLRVGAIAKKMEISERHVFRLKKEAIGLLCSKNLPTSAIH